ncbi:MAG: hypothetical protein AABZ44_07240, partial [Elusimicrobiota bacterium]
MVSVRQRTFMKALEYFDAALRINPHVKEYYVNYGRILLQRGLIDSDKAIKSHYFNQAASVFARHIKIAPWHALAYYNLAAVNIKRIEQLQEPLDEDVKSLLKKSMELAPFFSSAWNQYAETLWRSGKKDEAHRFWSDTIAINPTNLDARRWLEYSKPDPYIRFLPQEVRLSNVPVGSIITWDQLRLLNDTDTDASVELRLVPVNETLFTDINGYIDATSLGWAKIDMDSLSLPHTKLSKITGSITIPPWRWWKNKRFAIVIEARDKKIDYPIGTLGRVLIETVP